MMERGDEGEDDLCFGHFILEIDFRLNLYKHDDFCFLFFHRIADQVNTDMCV